MRADCPPAEGMVPWCRRPPAGEAAVTFDVFLSYAHQDAPTVDALEAALKRQSLRVWRDRSGIKDFNAISREVVEGLSESRVLLAYYSAEYPRSRACQWELTAAFLASQAEGDPLRRVLVVNPEPKPDHILPEALRGNRYPAGNDPDVIAASLAARLKDVPATPLGSVRTQTLPRWLPNGAARSWAASRFVGRLDDLWRVHTSQEGPAGNLISAAPGVGAEDLVWVRGLGGTGKSLLAEEYARRFGAAYPGGVFWLDASDGGEAVRTQAMRSIAEALGLPLESPERIDAEVARWLRADDKPFLWIVDDVPKGMSRQTLGKWLAPSTRGKTLITTRDRSHDGLGRTVDLPQLQPEDAYQLLTSRRPPAAAEKADAMAIVTELGRHALAVDVASEAVERLGYGGFLKRLKAPDKDALDLAAKLATELPNGHERSIAVTLRGSIDALDKHGRDVLRLASVLAPAPIPADLVTRVFAEADGVDEDDAEEIAALGTQQALAHSLADEEGADRAIVVHALVSRVVRFHDDIPARRDALRKAAILVAGTVMEDADDIRKHKPLEPWVPHARTLTAEAADEASLDLLGWVGWFNFERGAYGAAGETRRRLWEGSKGLLGEEHPYTLRSMGLLASTLWARGDLAGAQTLDEQVLAVRRRVLGAEHPDTLTSMNNLASALWGKGDFAGARTLEEQVLAVRRRVLGEEHPDTLISMNNLGETLRCQGDLARAWTLHKQALTTRQRVLGEGHPYTLMSMNNLGRTLQDQGDLPGALPLLRAAAAGFRRILGEEHPTTLRIFGNLYNLLLAMDDQAGLDALLAEAPVLAAKLLAKLGEPSPSTP